MLALPVASLFFLFSCSPAKYVPKGEYLLSKNKLTTTENNIPEEQLKGYILQRPNKKLLGIRFYLWLYNRSNIEKTRWPHNWLRKIGEEPVIYDHSLTNNSREQLKQFLENQGYYETFVEDTVKYRKRNAIVNYKIEYGKPYRIRSITYFFEDTSLISKVLPDTVNSIITKGMRFNKDKLQEERVRIETWLKENGYYKFSKEYIYYDAVIDPDRYAVDLTMNIKEYGEGNPDPYTKVRFHPKFRIQDVYIIPDLSETGSGGKYDTVQFRSLYFLNIGKPSIKPNAIANRNYILPDAYYRLSDVNHTYRNLSALNIVRFTNITFKEIDSVAAYGNDHFLDCTIELTQRKLQTLQSEITGTNSSGDLGIRGNLLYSNYNLFKGAEVFSMRVTGAVESLENQTKRKYSSLREIGAETSIIFPKFFSPFKLEGFVKKFAPKTTISASFNYQSRPDFTRSIANGSFSYRWNSNKFITHSVWPIELNYVQIYENRSSTLFLNSISNTPLFYSFQDHMINDARYQLELNNQSIGKSKNFFYAKFNIESAGNLLHLAHTTINPRDTAYTYKLFKVPYFQYVLGDFDLRYYHTIDRQNRVVYRLFAGMGYPFGNFRTLPYEKKYFSGGPNSIRAWNTRDLGPGSDTTRNMFSYFPNKNGDIKLEANVEFRFKLVWKVEAAFFVDAGNVWNLRKDVKKPGAEFNWNRFYKEIAVGSGFGTRFDFSFFLLRIDVGIKLRDPALPEADRWLNDFKNFKIKDDLHVKFGIGYPF